MAWPRGQATQIPLILCGCPVPGIEAESGLRLTERFGRVHSRGFWNMTLEVLCLCEELGGHLPRSHKDDCTFEKQDGRRG